MGEGVLSGATSARRAVAPPARRGSAGFSLILALTVVTPVHVGCDQPSCAPGYGLDLSLPATVDSLDCTLTIVGPRGQTLQNHVPAPAPGATTYCAPLNGAYNIDCLRDAPSDGSPQDFTITEDPVITGDFEKAVGGTSFEVSLACGSISILGHDPQSIGTSCGE